MLACGPGRETSVPAVLAASTASAGISQRPGGDLTVNYDNETAFTHVAPTADVQLRRKFAVGDTFFNDAWVEAPASTEGRDGLGPLFNGQSCTSCHVRDGRGRPPLGKDDSGVGLIARLSAQDTSGVERPHAAYGSQLQDKGIFGVEPEGRLQVTYTEQPGKYPDGSAYSLRVPNYDLIDLKYGPLGAATLMSPRVAPQTIGLGLLEAIDEADIIANADPDDLDQDGIRGKANRVIDLATGSQVMGRFGWKAGQPSVEQQSAAAFVNDIGITSRLFPAETCTAVQAECGKTISGGQPELATLPVDKLSRVTVYLQLTAVPKRRNADDADAKTGEGLFSASGCEGCHRSTYVTGSTHAIDLLHGQKIHPFTDLLLHDMGSGLADGRREGEADGRQWRTPPLWGIGLLPIVNRHSNLLHDGRARNIEEAILWHDGEGRAARDAFMSLPRLQRGQLIKFIETL